MTPPEPSRPRIVQRVLLALAIAVLATGVVGSVLIALEFLKQG